MDLTSCEIVSNAVLRTVIIKVIFSFVVRTRFAQPGNDMMGTFVNHLHSRHLVILFRVA